jgi:RNA polymerase-interacting CarD/CdnL/TRCF family regulator
VVRDLSSYGKTRKLNDNDLSILDRSRKFLLNEWRLSLSIPMSQADDELQKMLGESSHKG